MQRIGSRKYTTENAFLSVSKWQICFLLQFGSFTGPLNLLGSLLNMATRHTHSGVARPARVMTPPAPWHLPEPHPPKPKLVRFRFQKGRLPPYLRGLGSPEPLRLSRLCSRRGTQHTCAAPRSLPFLPSPRAPRHHQVRKGDNEFLSSINASE